MSAATEDFVTDKEKTTIFLILLTRQLEVWLKHARDNRQVTHKFKQESGYLMDAVKKFNKFLDQWGGQDDNEEIYEQSVTLSDLMEEFLKLDAKDIARVTGLIDKIKADKQKNLYAIK
jgi:hypothetical protein